MNRERVLTLFCAACCCFALVTLSSGLESTVSGSPEDEFDIGPNMLPVSSDETGKLKDAYQSASGTSGDAASRDAPPKASGSGEADDSQVDGKQAGSIRGDGGSSGSQAQADQTKSSGGGGRDDTGARSGQGTESTTASQERDWLSLLGQLLRVFLLISALAIPLAAAWLTTRHRKGVVAWLRSLVDRFGRERSDADDVATAHPFDPPANDVEQAWLDMARMANVEFDPGTTPQEGVDKLVQAGLDSDAVRELTALFERVHYGDTSATTERVQRARECLRRSFASGNGGNGQ